MPESIKVVPNGVDVSALLRLHPATVALLARFDIAAADPLLLMPVRVMARKNIELGLRVVAAMRAGGRPAGLFVVGPADPHDSTEGDYPATVLALRDRLGLGDAAWFPGLVDGLGLPDAVVADLYQLADALFMPSFEEGFGIPAARGRRVPAADRLQRPARPARGGRRRRHVHRPDRRSGRSRRSRSGEARRRPSRPTRGPNPADLVMDGDL